VSYIRSTTNPEGLYIVGTGKEVEFYKGCEYPGVMPPDVFNKLIDKWIENYQEDTEIEGAKIEEVWINAKGDPSRMRLSYKDWYIDMWYVTWYYIARSNYGRSKSPWKQRLMRRFFGNWI